MSSYASGAPKQINPPNPDALGLQLPPVETFPVPSAQESAQGLIMANLQSAYPTSPQGSEAIGTEPAYNQVIVPPNEHAPNHLYVSRASQTVAGCYIYAKLPLWMEISDPGDIWFYEWYQNGHLETDYAGHAYSPRWFKRWFYPNIPGWHTLQFYCEGWSNYVYIYVYSSSNSDYWVSPPNPYSPTPLPYNPQMLGNNTAKSQHNKNVKAILPYNPQKITSSVAKWPISWNPRMTDI